MSLFICCLWWFVLGLLLGWLLNWLLSRWLRREPPSGPSQVVETPPPAPREEPSPEAPVTMAAPAPPPPAPPAIDLAAARAAGFQLKHADDLTVVEGIGPKIDELFRAAGITTHAQLARLSVEEMRAILDKGGTAFKIANPGSWARQALLASENRWAELKKLQDELIGGVGPGGEA